MRNTAVRRSSTRTRARTVTSAAFTRPAPRARHHDQHGWPRLLACVTSSRWERLWRTITIRRGLLCTPTTPSPPRPRGLTRYLTLYNTRQPHSSLADQTPDEAYFTPLSILEKRRSPARASTYLRPKSCTEKRSHFCGLADGTYNATANVSSSVVGVTNSPQSIAVTLTVGQASAAVISVSPTNLTLAPSTTAQFTATARDASGNVLTSQQFSWSSANSDVATVSPLGLVTAVGLGTTTVTVSDGGVNVAAQIVINGERPALSSSGVPIVTLTATPQTLQPGQSTTLSWLSSSATSCVPNFTASQTLSGNATISIPATDFSDTPMDDNLFWIGRCGCTCVCGGRHVSHGNSSSSPGAYLFPPHYRDRRGGSGRCDQAVYTDLPCLQSGGCKLHLQRCEQ